MLRDACRFEHGATRQSNFAPTRARAVSTDALLTLQVASSELAWNLRGCVDLLGRVVCQDQDLVGRMSVNWIRETSGRRRRPTPDQQRLGEPGSPRISGNLRKLLEE